MSAHRAERDVIASRRSTSVETPVWHPAQLGRRVTTNNMSIPKVSLGFAALPDPDLDAFTETVIKSMTGNAHYATSIPPLPVLSTGLAAFTSALAAAAGGGKALTAAKNEQRENLLAILRQLAAYVQGACLNDLSILLSSGFSATSTNHAQSPLAKPAILGITNGVSTTLTLNVTAVTNAKSYEVRLSTTPGTWQDGGTYTQARRLVVPGLTPGLVYTFQVRAVGGATGYSDWSDSITHMAT